MRTRIFTALTVLLLAFVFGANLWLYGFAMENALYIDTSFEEFYSFSDPMKEACDTLLLPEEGNENPEVTITFCADPDTLRDSADTRYVYFMALKLAKKYDAVTVKTVNIKENATAVDKYKTTSLTAITSKHIIFSTPDAYRVTTAASFWMTSDDTLYSFQGEHRMMTMLLSLLSVDRPTAYFITGHGETVYDVNDKTSASSVEASELYDTLLDAGLKVGLLDLSTADKVPDDCVLLVLNNPRADFTYDESKLSSIAYQSELEKIDRYLVDRQGAMIVAKDYSLSLPNLEDYLFEWGFVFHDAQMIDMQNNLADAAVSSGTILIAEYDTDDSSYGYAIYNEITSLSSAARTVVPDVGYITCAFGADYTKYEDGTTSVARAYTTFLNSYSTAQSYADSDDDGTYNELNTVKGVHSLAGVGSRIYTDPETGDNVYSYVLAVASTEFFSPDVLGNASYGNRDVMALIIRNISRVDKYASMDLGGTSLNSLNANGKIILKSEIASGTGTTYVFYTSDDNRNLTKGDYESVVSLAGGKDDLTSYLRQRRREGVYYGETHAMSEGAKKLFIAFEISLPLSVLITGAVICLRRKFK